MPLQHQTRKRSLSHNDLNQDLIRLQQRHHQNLQSNDFDFEVVIKELFLKTSKYFVMNDGCK